MEKIKSKNKPNSKNNSEKKTKEKNKQDLKNKLINEIDNLILYTKGISNELILLSNTIEKDFIKDDMNNILMISKAINEMLETSINNLGKRIFNIYLVFKIIKKFFYFFTFHIFV